MTVNITFASSCQHISGKIKSKKNLKYKNQNTKQKQNKVSTLIMAKTDDPWGQLVSDEQYYCICHWIIMAQ